MNKLLTALFFAVSVVHVFADEQLQEESDNIDRVVVLTDDNWDKMMEEYKYMLVFFYHPEK